MENLRLRTKEETKYLIGNMAYYYESYSCAEASLRILTDVYDFILSPDFLKVGSINRGGACVDGVCGILESTMLFLSYGFGRSNPNEDYLRLEDWNNRISAVFRDALSGYTCGEIWYPLDKKIRTGEFSPKTHCVIYEGLMAISDTVYDAYVDLCRNFNRVEPHELRRVEMPEAVFPSSLSDRVSFRAKLYLSDGYICSEAAFRALSDEFAPEITEEQMRVATIYEKGGAFNDRCGVIEVALLILSYIYGRLDSRDKNNQDRLLSRRLHETVVDELNGFRCSDFVECTDTIERKCPMMDDVLRICADFISSADDVVKNELKSFVV